MSYIDKEKALEFVLNNTPHINGETTMECVERAIKEIPTADVVEVVRCKDCKYSTNYRISDEICDICTCGCAMINISPEYYCSYGERREG